MAVEILAENIAGSGSLMGHRISATTGPRAWLAVPNNRLCFGPGAARCAAAWFA